MSEQDYCDRCDGTGEYEGGDCILTKCEVCDGTGLIDKRMLEMRNQLTAAQARIAELEKLLNCECEHDFVCGWCKQRTTNSGPAAGE